MFYSIRKYTLDSPSTVVFPGQVPNIGGGGQCMRSPESAWVKAEFLRRMSLFSSVCRARLRCLAAFNSNRSVLVHRVCLSSASGGSGSNEEEERRKRIEDEQREFAENLNRLREQTKPTMEKIKELKEKIWSAGEYSKEYINKTSEQSKTLFGNSRKKAEEVSGKIKETVKEKVNLDTEFLNSTTEKMFKNPFVKSAAEKWKNSSEFLREKIKKNPEKDNSEKENQEENSRIGSFKKVVVEELTNIISPQKKQAYSRRDKAALYAKNSENESSQSSDSDTPTTQAVLIVDSPKTRWEELREKIEQKAPVLKRIYKVADKVRDTWFYRSSVEAKQKIDDKVEDMREKFETSQDPIVWRVREASEYITAETDTSAALSEFQRMDPEFSIPGFLEEMEYYMIPKVVKSYLQGDLNILRSVCSENALRNVVANVKQRQTLGFHMDERILDISQIEFHDATILDGSYPVITLTFVCQHVNCVRDNFGVIVEGSETELQTVHYTWLLTKDMESDDFNWKIVDMAVQGVTALI